MNIKTTLKIIVSLVLIISLIFAFSIYFTLARYRLALENTLILKDLASEVFERRMLADDYLFNSSERAKTQRLLSNEHINQTIKDIEPRFNTLEEKELFAKLKSGLSEGHQTFIEIVELNENSASEENVLSQEHKGRLASQLTVKAQQAISATATLGEIYSQEVTRNLNIVITLFSVAASLFFLMLLACFAILWRSASQLYSEKNKIQAVLRGIGDGVVVIDKDFNINLWNTAAEAITGFSHEDALGKKLKDVLKLIRSYDRKPDYAFIEEVLLLKEIRHMEDNTLLIKKDGTEINVGDSAAPILNANNELVASVIIFRDITKDIEARRLKSDFAYASHQLRTPITKSLGYTQLIMDETKSKKIKEDAQVAYQSLQSTAKVIDNLVSVAEVDQGRITPNIKPINLLAVLKESLESLTDIARERKVKITIPAGLDKYQVSADDSYFKRVLSKVIENAIIYNKTKGTVSIKINLQENNLIIEIRDTGIGILDQEKALIFTKFFRGSNFNTTEVIGAGLGLFLAQEYAKILKGKIWFDSKEDEGSVFYISLPKA